MTERECRWTCGSESCTLAGSCQYPDRQVASSVVHSHRQCPHTTCGERRAIVRQLGAPETYEHELSECLHHMTQRHHCLARGCETICESGLRIGRGTLCRGHRVLAERIGLSLTGRCVVPSCDRHPLSGGTACVVHGGFDEQLSRIRTGCTPVCLAYNLADVRFDQQSRAGMMDTPLCGYHAARFARVMLAPDAPVQSPEWRYRLGFCAVTGCPDQVVDGMYVCVRHASGSPIDVRTLWRRHCINCTDREIFGTGRCMQHGGMMSATALCAVPRCRDGRQVHSPWNFCASHGSEMVARGRVPVPGGFIYADVTVPARPVVEPMSPQVTYTPPQPQPPPLMRYFVEVTMRLRLASPAILNQTDVRRMQAALEAWCAEHLESINVESVSTPRAERGHHDGTDDRQLRVRRE